VLDIFDGNAYAKDTRKDFMTGRCGRRGAFDYSADKVGLTYGATADLTQSKWALRSGYFLMQSVSNSNSFDTRIFDAAPMCSNWKPAISCFAAGQAAHHCMAQQRQFRQLSRDPETIRPSTSTSR